MTKHKCRKLAFFPVMLIMAFSCSEPYPPIDRLTAEDLAAMAAMSSSSTESSSSAQKLAKEKISGVSQKGPFMSGTRVTISELDNNLTFTGRNFPSVITDDKGSFEIEVELVSPYVRLEADGYYRNEVTGGNNEQILLYAIADITDKNSVNINILTHLEYERVRILTGEGKSLKDAKKQAQGEILSVFGINGSSFKNSEDMSIFGTSESDAALLAVSVLLQGGLGAGDFTGLLSDFSQSLKNTGGWSEARKTGLADWASGADLGAIRGNILGWGLSSGVVPDFGKYVYSYWTANYDLGVCSTEGSSKKNSNANSEKKNVYYICLGNEWQEDKCADGILEYDPAEQFCHSNEIHNKCGGKIYNPLDSFCYTGDNKVYERCGTAKKAYDLLNQRCAAGGIVETKCGGSNWYREENQFCRDGEVFDFCEGRIYNPLDEFCSGNKLYEKCYAGEGSNQSTGQYNPAVYICVSNVSYPRCGSGYFSRATEGCCGNSSKYTLASQFCSGNDVHDKCGGTVTFTPGTEACCGSNKYTLATHFCYSYSNSKVGEKCGARTETYDPDLYKCVDNGKIYLKTPVSYGSENYEAVLIGSQTWMARNLNYNASGSWCYGDSTGGDSQNRCGTYGRLYNWSTAMNNSASSTANPSGRQGVCPSGWHIPSDGEWTALTDFVGGSNTAGTKLKATGWSSSCGPSGSGKTYLCEDSYGFSALPGGIGYLNGSFSNVGGVGHWWSATENEDIDSLVYYRRMGSSVSTVDRYSYRKSVLLSVCCVKD